MSSADWWARKLQQQQPPAPPARTQSEPQAPSQVPMTQFQQPTPTADPAAKAQSAKATETCPDCGSANFFGVQGSRPRCYECGYPMEQSGSRYGSLTGAKVEGDAKAARGNDAVNNYNPTQIIGRVD